MTASDPGCAKTQKSKDDEKNQWQANKPAKSRRPKAKLCAILICAFAAPPPGACRGRTQAAELANALEEEGFVGRTHWKAALSATESWIELLI
jgi:hypothetical protein